ncbi:MAG: hypothetical protein C4527_00345 [Candidatus Omnitrophota bacterium]|jgi:flagellar motor switch/type III secretory pathway protein FliN|nr:MAG: hypothetical protein C4527_00345 [Candidatus Omnitrophota bacterium]
MVCWSDLKLVDLLSLRPGSLLRLHTVKGEIGCREVEELSRSTRWREEISYAIFPNENPIKIHNFSKLLEVPLLTQVIIHHPDGKVVEILRLGTNSWSALLAHEGHRVDLMVEGRIIAMGEIVNTLNQRGILIKKVAS